MKEARETSSNKGTFAVKLCQIVCGSGEYVTVYVHLLYSRNFLLRQYVISVMVTNYSSSLTCNLQTFKGFCFQPTTNYTEAIDHMCGIERLNCYK